MKSGRLAHRGFGIHPDWLPILDNVRIVLVGTTHAGNIGAVARVMKNMALKKLTLVSSTACGPESDARPMASGAYEIVEGASRVDSLLTALNDTVMAIGTSARLGAKRISFVTPDQIMERLMETARLGPVACVFGRESKGLSNQELKLCTHQMIIPTDARFASMNVAHAVAVTVYEIFKIVCRPVGFQAHHTAPASVGSREEMFAHVERVLVRAGFLDKSNPLRMMRDIRRILNSAQLDDRDVTIIRGIFRKIGNMRRRFEMEQNSKAQNCLEDFTK